MKKKILKAEDLKKYFEAITDYFDVALQNIDYYLSDEYKRNLKCFTVLAATGELSFKFSIYGQGKAISPKFENETSLAEIIKSPQTYLNLMFSNVMLAFNNAVHINPVVSFCTDDIYRERNMNEKISDFPEYFSSLGIASLIGLRDIKKVEKHKDFLDIGINHSLDLVVDWYDNVEVADSLLSTKRNGGGIYFKNPVTKQVKDEMFSKMYIHAFSVDNSMGRYRANKFVDFIESIKSHLPQELVEESLEYFIIKNNNLKNLQLLERVETIVGNDFKSEKFKEIRKLRKNNDENSLYDVVDLSKVVIIEPNILSFSEFSYFNRAGEHKLEKAGVADLMEMMTKMMMKAGLKEFLGVTNTSEFKFPGGNRVLMLTTTDNFTQEKYLKYCQKCLPVITEISKKEPLGSFSSFAGSKEALSYLSLAVKKWLVEDRIKSTPDVEDSPDESASPVTFKM